MIVRRKDFIVIPKAIRKALGIIGGEFAESEHGGSFCAKRVSWRSSSTALETSTAPARPSWSSAKRK